MKHTVIALITLLLTNSVHADLIHRYSFEKDLKDSIGPEHGQAQGNARVENGQLVLDGKSWVALPGGLVTPLKSATIEAWFTFQKNGAYVRVYDFGNTNDKGMGAFCWYFSPQCPETPRTVFSNTDPGYTYEETIDYPALTENKPYHVMVVYDGDTATSKLYLNGQLAGIKSMTIRLSDIGTEHLYLGKSSYNPDSLLKGTIQEFRVYNHAVPDLQYQLNHLLGPDQIQACLIAEVTPDSSKPVNPDSPVLTWTLTPNAKPAHFEVAISRNPDSLKETPVFVRTEKAELPLGQLAPQTTYYWRVDTIDALGTRVVGPLCNFTTR